MAWKSIVGICVYMTLCRMQYLTIAENIYINVGETAQLTCNTDITYPIWAGPEGVYNYEGSAGLNPTLGEKTSRLSWGTNKHDLHISNVRRNDSGNYTCQGSVKNYLYVRDVPLPPRVMESQGTTITGSEGVMLTLTCKSSGGFPESNIIWYQRSSSSSSNALDTTTTSVHNIFSDTYNITGTHSFLPSSSDDGVQFICLTFFKDGSRNEQQTEVTLSLNLKPRQPTIEQLANVTAGNNVEVRCRTTGSRPAAAIYWLYQNTNLTGTSTTELDSSTNTYMVVSVLTRQVTALDNGQIVRCRVTHTLLEPSQLTSTLNLNVQFSAKASSTTITGNKVFIATGSNNLTLICTTGSSNPASGIIWKNNSVPISNSGQYTTWRGENNGQVRSQNLVLTPTRYMDGDVITCSVSNVVDTQSPITDTTTLILQYSPIILIEGQQQNTFTEGESKLLSCKVDSKPTSTIEWYHGNSMKSQGNPGNNILNYSLTPVNRTHYGVYRCKANNGIGTEDEEQISVNIRFKPLITTIFGNTNIIANEKNQLRLTCTSGSSNPLSHIEWKSNTDIPLNIGSQSSVSGEYGGIKSNRTVTLTPSRENDGDTLSCQANNTIGTSTKSTSTLDLKYNPLIQSLSDVVVVEGNKTELTCIASSKPASTFKWYREGHPSSVLKQGNGTLANNKLSYTINIVKRTDASNYTCHAENGIEIADNQNVRLTVHYPPDVTPQTTNTTVNEAFHMITCNASGIPNINYKYGKWVQTWPGYSTPVLERDGSRILELTKLTYEHSGIYTCSASNGIQVFGSNQEFKEGSVQLLVKSFPVVTACDDKSPARIKENATVKVDFYSNIDGSTVKCFKTVDGSEETQVSCSVSEAAVEVDLPVFTHTIKTAGTRAMVMIEIQTEKDFGSYKVVVQNEINSTSRSVQIVPKGPPSVPYNMTVDEVQINTAQISWIRGFHGGFAQTFVIQFSTDLSVWRNKSLDGGLSESKEPVSTVLSGLKDSTTYYVRMYAVNQEGKSQYTDILNYTTSFIEEQPPINSALIGGAAGGSAALIVILVVVIVVITLRRRGFFAKDKSSTHADKSDRKPVYEDDDDNGMQDNPMYESAGPRNQGQSAGASRSCDVGAVYSTVDKNKPFIGNSNDVYAEVDKSKKTGQKPGKKEKSKPDKKGKKAAKEGELYANAAATEMKITKTKQNANDETIYENPEPSKQKAKKNVNKDGLIYADLTFNDQPKGQKKLVIHGLDSMTEYVEVDFTKKADPLPDSDDENDSQRK